MTTANERLFNKLRLRSSSHQHDKIPRFIETNPTEKKRLLDTRFYSDSTYVVSETTAIFFAEFDSSIYAIAKGIRSQSVSDQLSLAAIDAGTFTAIVSELPISVAPHITDVDLDENIFFPSEDTDSGPPSPVGYRLDEIQPLFEPFGLYLINVDSPLLQDNFADRIALHLLATTRTSTRLPFRDVTLNRFADAAITPAANFPHKLLFRAYMEHRWDQAFLDLYRCLEQLFPFARVGRLMDEINQRKASTEPSQTVNPSSSSSEPQPSNILLYELAELTESVLGWRAKEDDAICELIESLSAALLLEIYWYLGIDCNHEKAAVKAAEQLYRMRNRAVHFRPIHSAEPEPNPDEWECTTTWLLRAVCALYEIVGKQLRNTSQPLGQQFKLSI